MKVRKKLSLLLSFVLLLNVVFTNNFKVKAEEVDNAKVQSVSVSKTEAKAGDSLKVNVEVSNSNTSFGATGYMLYVSPSGQTKEVDLKLVEGTTGKYEGNIKVEANDQIATWKIDFIIVNDDKGNATSIYNSVIHGNNGQDLSGGDFKVQYYTADPANGAKGVALDQSVQIAFLENIAEGKEFDSIAIKDMLGNNVELIKTISDNTLTLKAKNNFKYNGTYSIIVPMDSIVKVDGLTAVLGTPVYSTFSTLTDNTLPELVKVGVDKKNVKAGDVVNFTIEASDAVPGLADTASMMLVSGTKEKELDLTLVDGKYTAKVEIDDSITAGDWKISYISLEDKAYNSVIVYNANVHGYGKNLGAADFSVDLIAPEIIAINPKNQQTEVQLNNEITIVLSEKIAKGNGFDSITLKDNYGRKVELSTEIKDNLFIVHAKDGLKYNGSYSFEIPHNALTDIAGNELKSDLKTTFTTVKEATLPQFVRIYVDKSEANKGDKVTITVEASDEVPGMSDKANLLLVNGEKEINVELALVNGKYKGSITVDENTAEGKWQVSFVTIEDNAYNVAIVYNSKIHGGTGVDLSPADFTVNFAGTAADNNPPVVVDGTPSTNLPLEGSITIKFNEEIQQGVDFDKIQLVDEAGNVIEATVEIKGNTLVITPKVKLEAGKNYLVVVPADAIKDIKGNSLSGNSTTFQFATAPPAPVIPKTGSPVDMSSMMAVGLMFVLLGTAVFAVYRKKRSA